MAVVGHYTDAFSCAVLFFLLIIWPFPSLLGKGVIVVFGNDVDDILSVFIGLHYCSFFIKSTLKTNKRALLLASALGLLIPTLNSFKSGLCFSKSLLVTWIHSLLLWVGW